MEHRSEELMCFVIKAIERHSTQPRISPSWIATEVMVELDPDRVSIELVYFSSHVNLRHMARAQLRKRFGDGVETESEQHELFPDLQRRYPIARTKPNEEPVYVLLELMTDEDIDFNVARLRQESAAKARSADALAHYKETRRPAVMIS